MKDVLFKNVRLLDPTSGLDAQGDLLARDGLIAQIAPGGLDIQPEHADVIEGSQLCLAPGLVDMRVRFGEPGGEHRETMASGCRAAAAGGVTTLALLPDTNPVIDDPAMVEFVARRARLQKGPKVFAHAAITRSCEGHDITEVGLLAEAGAVGFSNGGAPLRNSQVVRRALSLLKSLDKPLLSLPVEPDLGRGSVATEGEIATRLGLPAVPTIAELMMVERDIRLAELTSGWIHVGPVTTEASIAAIRAAKARGVHITCDTAPHYFALNELSIEGYRTYARVEPPLRSEEDRLAICKGLADGTIDAIASDHHPQDQDSKRVPFIRAHPGVVGLETLLPVSLDLVHHGDMSLLDLVSKLTSGPAGLIASDAGTLQVGRAADLVLFDPEKPGRITEEGLHSLSRNTAFEGKLVQGHVVGSWVDGRRLELAA